MSTPLTTRLDVGFKLIDIYNQEQIDYFEILKDRIDQHIQIWRQKCVFTQFFTL